MYNPMEICAKCLTNNPKVDAFPSLTVYTKFVLALYTGKKEAIANKAIIAHMVLSPLRNLNFSISLLINFEQLA